MRKTLHNPFAVTIAALAVLFAVVGGASAQFGTPSDAGGPVGNAGDVVTRLAAVPAVQAQAFGDLRKPAAASVSSAVREQIATGPDVVRAYGLDLAQVRSVGAGGRSFYLAPARNGLCLFLEDGTSVCNGHLGDVTRYGISVAVVPPGSGPAGPNMKSPIGPGDITTFGVVPDGVTQVVGSTTSGKDVDATINGNAYVLVTDAPVLKTTFRSVSSSWTTPDPPAAP
ncbi:MAG: hypothetical protein JWR63_2833 [Conexibacter sp.]|nr:hypothetical protein [Conexibacter sp.]